MQGGESNGGAERDRTAGLLVANEALSQLSYSPTTSQILPAITQSAKKPLVAPGLDFQTWDTTNPNTKLGKKSGWESRVLIHCRVPHPSRPLRWVGKHEPKHEPR